MFLYTKLLLLYLEIVLIINVFNAQRNEETGRYVYLDEGGIRRYCHYCNRTVLEPPYLDEYVEQKCIAKNYPFENKTDEEEQMNQWRPVCSNGTIPSCPELEKEVNGVWNCSLGQNKTEVHFNETEGSHIFPVYTDCKLTCNNGFNVTETSSTYCNESRQWDPDPGSIYCFKVTDLKENLEGRSSYIAWTVGVIAAVFIITIIIACLFKLWMRRHKVYTLTPRIDITDKADPFSEHQEQIYRTQTYLKEDGMDASEPKVKTETSSIITGKGTNRFQREGGAANFAYIDVQKMAGQKEKNKKCSFPLLVETLTENAGKDWIKETACHQKRMDKNLTAGQGVELENDSVKATLRRAISLENEIIKCVVKEANRTFPNSTEGENELRTGGSDDVEQNKVNFKYQEDIKLDILQTSDDGDHDKVTCMHEEHINFAIIQKPIKIKSFDSIIPSENRSFSSHKLTVSDSKEYIKEPYESQYHSVIEIERELFSNNEDTSIKSSKVLDSQKSDKVDRTENSTNHGQVGNKFMDSKILKLQSIEETATVHENIGNNVSEARSLEIYSRNAVYYENEIRNSKSSKDQIYDTKSKKEESENGEDLDTLEEVQWSTTRTVEETLNNVDNDHMKVENEKKSRNETSLDQVIDVEMITNYTCLQNEGREEKVTTENNNDKSIESKLPMKEEMSHYAEYRDRIVSTDQWAEAEIKTTTRVISSDNGKEYNNAPVEQIISLTQGDDSMSLENCEGFENFDRQNLFGEEELGPDDRFASRDDVVEYSISCGDDVRVQQFLDDFGTEDEDKVLKYLTYSLSFGGGGAKQKIAMIFLSWICNELTKLHNPHTVKVWPATIAGKNSAQELPILICNYWGDVIETYRDKRFYGLSVKYQEYDTVNDEELSIRARKEFMQSKLSKKDAKDANAVVSEKTDWLMKNHTNLEIIKPCHVRSVQFQSENIKTKANWEVMQETSIVLYCRMKGYIPFGENLFPKTLTTGQRSLPVDVREGYFVTAMMEGSSTFTEAGGNWNTDVVTAEEEWDPRLFRMGVSMGPHDKIIKGTVGPFVHLGDNVVGFLTCAHVFGIPSTINSVKGKAVVHPANGEYVSVHGTNSDDVCGHIGRIVFDVNPDHPVSVDAAIIKITPGKKPNKGRFARMDAPDLSEAGLHPGQSLKFDNGEIVQKETIENEHLKQGKFIKVGAKSGITSSNCLGHERIVVRVREDAVLDHDDGDLSPPIVGGSRSYLMKGQYVILSKPRNQFLSPGDSGCGVFHMDEHNKLRCVGIGIGSMSFGREAVVTPIEDVLRALELGEDALMKFVSTSDLSEDTHL